MACGRPAGSPRYILTCHCIYTWHLKYTIVMYRCLKYLLTLFRTFLDTKYVKLNALRRQKNDWTRQMSPFQNAFQITMSHSLRLNLKCLAKNVTELSYLTTLWQKWNELPKLFQHYLCKRWEFNISEGKLGKLVLRYIFLSVKEKAIRRKHVL